MWIHKLFSFLMFFLLFFHSFILLLFFLVRPANYVMKLLKYFPLLLLFSLFVGASLINYYVSVSHSKIFRKFNYVYRPPLGLFFVLKCLCVFIFFLFQFFLTSVHTEIKSFAIFRHSKVLRHSVELFSKRH